MATFPMDVPDVIVADTVRAIATDVQVLSTDATVVAIARRALTGAATSDAEKVLLAQTFCKLRMKESLLNLRSQEAAAAARTNKNDPAVTW